MHCREMAIKGDHCNVPGLAGQSKAAYKRAPYESSPVRWRIWRQAPSLDDAFACSFPEPSETTVEDVIEQLRELNEPVPVPLELPDDDLLVEIEEQLLINLPFGLREFLLQVSDVVYGRLEPVTATDPHSHTFLPEVAANAWDAGVPRDLLPICQDGPDYYVVDLEGEVTLFSGESAELTEQSWESVWHWARDVWLQS